MCDTATNSLIGDMMTNKIKQSYEDLPFVRKFCLRLTVITNDPREIRVRHDDLFGKMAVIFLAKMTEHLRVLLAIETSRDTALIARCMLEGVAQLMWAADSPQERALMWQNYACITDLKNINDCDLLGIPITKNDRKGVIKNLKNHGSEFLTGKGRKYLKKEGELPVEMLGYYHMYWMKQKLTPIVRGVGDHHFKWYQDFCVWHHWNTGIAVAVEYTEDKLTYFVNSPIDTLFARMAGFESLLKTAEITNSHLKVGWDSRLEEVSQEFDDWILTSYPDLNSSEGSQVS
jgi:hypothetical protein